MPNTFFSRAGRTQSALALFLSGFPGSSGPDWEDLVVAQDFGLLHPSEILAFLGAGSLDRPLTRAMLESQGGFEQALWQACGEVTGTVPRPGSKSWEIAQDRWRIVLLRHAQKLASHELELSTFIQDVYEHLGYPEDMLGLCQSSPSALPLKLQAFLKKLENRLSAAQRLPMPLAS